MRPDLDLTSLLGGLARANVDFVVIGGVAVIAHGYERNTKALTAILRLRELPNGRG